MKPLPYSGWTWFNEPKVLNFLTKNGLVYSVRKRLKKEGWGYAKKGREILFKIIVKRMSDVDLGTLSHFVNESGFDNVDKWIEAINRQHSTNWVNLAIFKVEKLVGVEE